MTTETTNGQAFSPSREADSPSPADRRQPPDGLSEGLRCRDKAVADLKRHRAKLVEQVQTTFLRLLYDRGPQTTDSVRDVVAIPKGTDPRLVGAAIRGLVTGGLIRPTGRRRSRRPEAHARVIDLWAVKDRHKAASWLAGKGQPIAAPPVPPPAAKAPTLFDGL